MGFGACQPGNNAPFCGTTRCQNILSSLLGNDGVMTLSRHNKMGLLSNSQKGCDFGQHFWFCHIWVTWRRCVVHLQHVTADISIFLYNFEIFAVQSIANIVLTNSYWWKVLFKSLEAEYENSNVLINSSVKKTSEKVLTSKICHVNPKKLHCKCIRANPALFPFFHFSINCELTKLIWGNLHDSSPLSCCLSSFY